MKFSGILPTLPALFLLAAGECLVAADRIGGGDALESAKREFERGKLDEALAILDQSGMSKDPSERWLDLRGCILLEQEKFDEAVKLFSAAREKDRKGLAQLHLGDALLRQGKWEEARAAYQLAIKETSVLMLNERLRFGLLVTHLGAKDEASGKQALAAIPFPTESAAYYYAQAAWAFVHGGKREGEKWLARAEEIFSPKETAWFARPFFDFGWLKTKPLPVAG